jgi:hypothetical protein
MQAKHAVIQQHLTADEEERLAMFLNHRKCRRQFIKIEMAALKAAKAQNRVAQPAPGYLNRHMNFHNACLGWLKRCWTTR